jgi:hypothetical protein
MNGTSKNKSRKSDRFGSHTESLRVGASVSPAAVSRQAAVERFAKRHYLHERGLEIYNNDPGPCVECGAPSMRVWKNKGWCKAHAPERVSK